MAVVIEKKVEDLKIGDIVKGFGKVMDVLKNNVRVQVRFENLLRSFKFGTLLDCECIQGDKTGDISLNIEKLKEGIIVAECSCGGHVEHCYEGEVSETYNYYCECGATLTIDGYSIDAAMDVLMQS